MRRKIAKKERGLFEKVPGSGIWWIRYEIAGVERREKVGRRGDAIKLYAIRKADGVRGVKLPANMKHKGVKFKVIAHEAIDWYINHERKDLRNFKGRMALILETSASGLQMRSNHPRSIHGLAHRTGPQRPRTGTRMSSVRHSRLHLPMAK
jgi:hypothetical protein